MFDLGGPSLHGNLGQVINTYVPLSASRIIWYWPKGGDTPQLERKPWPWLKVMAAYLISPAR